MITLRRLLRASLLAALFGLGGCATTGGNPDDPLERYNRAMFGFNDGVDKAIFKPVASGYKKVVPEVARRGVTNFFANLGDIWIGVNNILQGKVRPGLSDFGRFAMNSTVGVLGLFDVASNAGLEKHNEDFGQTLGRWGVGSGPYVVLPFFGPSDVRDGFSLLAVDWRGYPLWYVDNTATRNELVAVRYIDDRANLLDVGRLAEEAALDRYSYVRGAYMQRRRSLIYDGNVPQEADPDKASQSRGVKDGAARAETEPPRAPITTGPDGRDVPAVDEGFARAIESGDARPAPSAATPESAGVSGSVYEPKIPFNHDALIADSGEVRTELARTGPKP